MLVSGGSFWQRRRADDATKKKKEKCGKVSPKYFGYVLYRYVVCIVLAVYLDQKRGENDDDKEMRRIRGWR